MLCKMEWDYCGFRGIQSKDDADSEELHEDFIKLAEWQDSKGNPM